MKEEWRDIPGYEGLYRASDKGRVLSMKREVPRKTKNGIHIMKLSEVVMSIAVQHKGYCFVNLVNRSSKRKKMYIHRAVLLSFLGEDKKKTDVNHIDHIPSNNKLENLEWVTRSENMFHSSRAGRLREKNSKSVIRSDGRVFISAADAARDLGLPRSNVTHHLARPIEKKHVRGFTFKYLETTK